MSQPPEDPYGASPSGSEPPPPPTNPYGVPDPGQSWSAQPPPPVGPVGQPPYGYPPYGQVAPDHQQATTVLVMGILGLIMCQVLSPVAWYMGNRVVGEIDASGGRVGGRSAANAGRICGIIGTVLLVLAVVAVVLLVVLAIASVSTLDNVSTSP